MKLKSTPAEQPEEPGGILARMSEEYFEQLAHERAIYMEHAYFEHRYSAKVVCMSTEYFNNDLKPAA